MLPLRVRTARLGRNLAKLPGSHPTHRFGVLGRKLLTLACLQVLERLRLLRRHDQIPSPVNGNYNAVVTAPAVRPSTPTDSSIGAREASMSTSRFECCGTWDTNPLLAETALIHARLDGYPVAEGHALVIPKRHVGSFVELTPPELLDLHALIAGVCEESDADSFTIAVNDGPAAGRTVHHLHVHVIPRRPGDVPDPRGGVRRLLLDPAIDPWLTRR